MHNDGNSCSILYFDPEHPLKEIPATIEQLDSDGHMVYAVIRDGLGNEIQRYIRLDIFNQLNSNGRIARWPMPNELRELRRTRISDS